MTFKIFETEYQSPDIEVTAETTAICLCNSLGFSENIDDLDELF